MHNRPVLCEKCGEIFKIGSTGRKKCICGSEKFFLLTYEQSIAYLKIPKNSRVLLFLKSKGKIKKYKKSWKPI